MIGVKLRYDGGNVLRRRERAKAKVNNQRRRAILLSVQSVNYQGACF